MRKEREFVYTGDPIPKIDRENHADFILHYQRSVLLSLVKKNLITLSQYEGCVKELERRHK